MVYTSLAITAFFVTSIITLLTLISYQRLKEQFKGIREWIVGVNLNSIALVISGLTTLETKFIFVPFILALFMLGNILLLRGISRFFILKNLHLDVIIINFLLFSLALYFLWFDDQISFQILALQLALIYTYVRSIMILLIHGDKQNKMDKYMFITILLSLVIVSAIRSINGFNVDLNNTNALIANDLGYTLMLIQYLLFIIMAIYFNLFINQKTHIKVDQEQEKFKIIFNESPLAMMMLDEDGQIIEINQRFADIFGFKSKDIVGLNIQESKLFELVEKELLDDIYEMNPNIQNIELSIMNANQERIQCLLNTSFIQYDDNVHTLMTFTNISEIHKLKEKLYYYAHYDLLTELPNRRKFMKYVEGAKKSFEKFAIVTIDLDDFKQINDMYGHDAGDEVLKLMAQKLKNNLEEDDFIARYGGDEFVLVVNYQRDKEVLEERIKRVTNILSKGFIYRDYRFQVTASIGYAVYPLHGTEINDLMRKADIAMYSVKRHQKNDFKVFEG